MAYRIEVYEIIRQRGVTRTYQRLRSKELVDETHPEFGYVEDDEAIVEKEEKVYEQTVDSANLQLVIRAVNNMPIYG